MKQKNKTAPMIHSVAIFMVFTINTIAAQQEGSIVTTQNGSSASFHILDDDSHDSTIYFWTHHNNTAVKLDIITNYNVTKHFNITQPDVWHIGYLTQPVTKDNRTAGIIISHAKIFVNFDYQRIKSISVSSNNPVYWAFCTNRRICVLVRPDISSSGGTQYVVVPLIVVCVLLLVVVVVLSLRLFCKHSGSSYFHIYEKPIYPPVPPPVFQRVVIQPQNDSGDTRGSRVRETDSSHDNLAYHYYDEWSSDTHDHRRFHLQDNTHILYQNDRRHPPQDDSSPQPLRNYPSLQQNDFSLRQNYRSLQNDFHHTKYPRFPQQHDPNHTNNNPTTTTPQKNDQDDHESINSIYGFSM
ncbi:uncharacterized protein [Cherax quadricarinatus]|uniref:uncharacterized protein isoform X1 n=1 Tax=Cherax quadricarinatus TaxID=27406 RepID=UPI00387EE4B5